jgi:hypothetical protein
MRDICKRVFSSHGSGDVADVIQNDDDGTIIEGNNVNGGDGIDIY